MMYVLIKTCNIRSMYLLYKLYMRFHVISTLYAIFLVLFCAFWYLHLDRMQKKAQKMGNLREMGLLQ